MKKQQSNPDQLCFSIGRPPATAAGGSAKDKPESKREEGCRTNAGRVTYFGTSQPDWNIQVS